MFILISTFFLVLLGSFFIYKWIFPNQNSIHLIQKKIKNAFLAISLEQWQKAYKILKPLVEADKGGEKAFYYLIQAEREMHQLSCALDRATMGARRFPENLLFRLEEAKSAYLLKKYDRAYDAFKVCEPILREQSDLLCYAKTLYEKQKYTEAISWIEPILSQKHEDELYIFLGDLHYAKNAFIVAISYFQKAFHLGITTKELFLKLAHAYRRYGNLMEAERLFKEILTTDREDESATLGLGACIEERKNYRKALLLYESSPAWSNRSTNLTEKAALMAIKVEKYQRAEEYLKELLKTPSPKMQWYSYFGFALQIQEKWHEAEQIYCTMVQKFPQSAYGYRALAWLFAAGKTKSTTRQNALSLAHIAVKLQNDTTSWEILSACEARLGNYEKAYQIHTALYKKDLNPQNQRRLRRAIEQIESRTPLAPEELFSALEEVA